MIPFSFIVVFGDSSGVSEASMRGHCLSRVFEAVVDAGIIRKRQSHC